MIFDVIKWYLVLGFFGLTSFPVVFRFLKGLPSRGAAFSRALGLIVISFVYWLLGTMGFLKNETGSLVLVVLAWTVLSTACWWKQRDEIRVWAADAKGFLIASEIVFFAAFLFIISFRLGGPEVSGTEKPMEMMFINSILRSETFPPRDAWLSGYSISYYYFGYIMTAVLVMLSGVPSAVGFNLMLASVFGMAAAGAFGILNDMLTLKENREDGSVKTRLRSLAAPVFILIAGNLEGLFEVMHSLHLFWNADGTSAFWSWLGLKELTEAPTRLPSFDPTGRSGIWWWRASRVVGDLGLEGSVKEVIDEFPMFSFELGDLHPHVIAIPFVLFAVGIALNALISGLKQPGERIFFAEGIANDTFSLKDTSMGKWILSWEFWLTAVCIGALLFLNMWDFPFYFGLYCLCVTAAYVHRNGWNREGIAVLFETALPLGIGCVLLYSMFFLSFSSQAGGIIPSGVFVTRPVHFLIMFGFFLIPILWWQFRQNRNCSKVSRRFGTGASLWILIALTALECLVFAGLIFAAARGGSGAAGTAAAAFVDMQQIRDPGSGITGFLSRRLNALPTLIILFVMAGLSFARIRQFARPETVLQEEKPADPCAVFNSLLILFAAGLVVFPEFFYLRDLFGTRMNTIFKFYYQAWIRMGLAAAYGSADLLKSLRGVGKSVFAFVMLVAVAAVMIYPAFCAAGKWQSLGGKRNLTLDGADFLRHSRYADWAGVEWLMNAEPGVVLEKVGSSYGSDNIVSTFAGLPSVLGPAGHESQWRGGYAEIGSRSDDVKRIYETHSWESADELLKTYGIRYIFIGSSEKSAYNIQEKKFERNLDLVYDVDGCKIYRVF